MKIERSIDVLKLGRITVTYTECDHDVADNGIIMYNEHKISIHLTDGLFGVINEKIVGGERGDVLLFAPDEIHFGRFAFSATYRFINFYFSSEFVEAISFGRPPLAELFWSDSARRINCIRGSYEEKSKITEIAEQLIPLICSSDPLEEMKLFSTVLSLLLLCAELYPKQLRLPDTAVDSPYVRRTIEYIIAHYCERITVFGIAEYIGCSTVYLSRIFKRYMGRSVYQYLTEYRIRKAIVLLNAGCSVTEACYSVGFCDCSNFIRTFRELVGITPYRYRKQRKSAKEG